MKFDCDAFVQFLKGGGLSQSLSKDTLKKIESLSAKDGEDLSIGLIEAFSSVIDETPNGPVNPVDTSIEGHNPTGNGPTPSSSPNQTLNGSTVAIVHGNDMDFSQASQIPPEVIALPAAVLRTSVANLSDGVYAVNSLSSITRARLLSEDVQGLPPGMAIATEAMPTTEDIIHCAKKSELNALLSHESALDSAQCKTDISALSPTSVYSILNTDADDALSVASPTSLVQQTAKLTLSNEDEEPKLTRKYSASSIRASPLRNSFKSPATYSIEATPGCKDCANGNCVKRHADDTPLSDNQSFQMFLDKTSRDYLLSPLVFETPKSGPSHDSSPRSRSHAASAVAGPVDDPAGTLGKSERGMSLENRCLSRGSLEAEPSSGIRALLPSTFFPPPNSMFPADGKDPVASQRGTPMDSSAGIGGVSLFTTGSLLMPGSHGSEDYLRFSQSRSRCASVSSMVSCASAKSGNSLYSGRHRDGTPTSCHSSRTQRLVAVTPRRVSPSHSPSMRTLRLDIRSITTQSSPSPQPPSSKSASSRSQAYPSAPSPHSQPHQHSCPHGSCSSPLSKHAPLSRSGSVSNSFAGCGCSRPTSSPQGKTIPSGTVPTSPVMSRVRRQSIALADDPYTLPPSELCIMFRDRQMDMADAIETVCSPPHSDRSTMSPLSGRVYRPSSLSNASTPVSMPSSPAVPYMRFSSGSPLHSERTSYSRSDASPGPRRFGVSNLEISKLPRVSAIRVPPPSTPSTPLEHKVSSTASPSSTPSSTATFTAPLGSGSMPLDPVIPEEKEKKDATSEGEDSPETETQPINPLPMQQPKFLPYHQRNRSFSLDVSTLGSSSPLLPATESRFVQQDMTKGKRSFTLSSADDVIPTHKHLEECKKRALKPFTMHAPGVGPNRLLSCITPNSRVWHECKALIGLKGEKSASKISSWDHGEKYQGCMCQDINVATKKLRTSTSEIISSSSSIGDSRALFPISKDSPFASTTPTFGNLSASLPSIMGIQDGMRPRSFSSSFVGGSGTPSSITFSTSFYPPKRSDTPGAGKFGTPTSGETGSLQSTKVTDLSAHSHASLEQAMAPVHEDGPDAAPSATFPKFPSIGGTESSSFSPYSTGSSIADSPAMSTFIGSINSASSGAALSGSKMASPYASDPGSAALTPDVYSKNSDPSSARVSSPSRFDNSPLQMSPIPTSPLLSHSNHSVSSSPLARGSSSSSLASHVAGAGVSSPLTPPPGVWRYTHPVHGQWSPSGKVGSGANNSSPLRSGVTASPTAHPMFLGTRMAEDPQMPSCDVAAPLLQSRFGLPVAAEESKAGRSYAIGLGIPQRLKAEFHNDEVAWGTLMEFFKSVEGATYTKSEEVLRTIFAKFAISKLSPSDTVQDPADASKTNQTENSLSEASLQNQYLNRSGLISFLLEVFSR